MNTLLGYQNALVLAALATHSLTAAEAHAAEQFVLDEVAQVTGRLAFNQEDLAFNCNWSDSGVQYDLRDAPPPRGQLAAVVSPVAALLLGVAAALYQLCHKKQLQPLANRSIAVAEGHKEAGVTAGHTGSDCNVVDAVPDEALVTPEKSCQEGVGRRKLFSALLPAVASAAANAHQSVVAYMARIWGHDRSCVAGSVLSTTGTTAGSTSSASNAGSPVHRLQVEDPTSDATVNISDDHLASYSSSTTAPSASTSDSSVGLNNSGQLHHLSAGSLCAAPAVASSRRQCDSEDSAGSYSHNSVSPFSSNSECNLEQAIRRGSFVTPEGHPDLSSITKALIDTAAGLSYLHSMGAVHGDLKPANVLLKSTTRGFKCRITDFGLSKTLEENPTHVNMTNLGTLDYTAPEMLQEGCLTSAADIYSFGLIMWELYTGTRVFGEGLAPGQIYCMVALHGWRPKVPESMPADYAALMQACWEADRHQRPTIGKVLKTLQKPCFSGEVTGYWEPRSR